MTPTSEIAPPQRHLLLSASRGSHLAYILSVS